MFCEKYEDISWSSIGGYHKACFMRDSITIDAPGTTIGSARDDTIKALYLAYNKNVFFLPERVHEVYPNLLIYVAGGDGSPLKTMSKVNFRKLRHLTDVDVENSQIESIESSTFEDLIFLERIWLSELIPKKS